MENPVDDVEAVIYKLTTGSPRLQQRTLEHYFTPNASFHHPVCAVHRNRNQILSIFRWYKILSPEIEIRVNGIAYEEARQRLYVDVSQTFRIWIFAPLGYRADVNLVTVLQLTRDLHGQDASAERPFFSNNSVSPSSDSNALSAKPSPFTPDGTEKPVAVLPSTAGPVRYWIKSQTDLYQTTDMVRFVSLVGLLPLLISLWHTLATYTCVLCAWLSTPISAAMQRYSDKQVEHRAKVRSNPAFGPNFGVVGTADARERQRQRDVWELEARFLNGAGAMEGAVGKLEGLKMKMKTIGKRGNGDGEREPVLDWMKMERAASGVS